MRKLILLILLPMLAACEVGVRVDSKPSPTPAPAKSFRLRLLESLAEFSRSSEYPKFVGLDCREFQVTRRRPEEGGGFSILMNSGGPEFLFDAQGEPTKMREFDTSKPDRIVEYLDGDISKADDLLQSAVVAVVDRRYYRSQSSDKMARRRARRLCED